MSRKPRKQKAAEETTAPPPDPPAEEVPAAPEVSPQYAPEPEPEPAQIVESKDAPPPAPAPPGEDELPPPPSDIAEQVKGYPPLNPRKPGVGTALKRAGAILAKDIGTMAKHGLISSVIFLICLIVLFYLASFMMVAFTSLDFGGGDGEDGNGPNLSNDGSLMANGGSDMTVSSGTLVTFDSSSTTHRANLMYLEWRIEARDGQFPSEVSLYGPQPSYRFAAVGQYAVTLSVVDADWNFDEDNLTVTVNHVGSDDIPPTIKVDANISDPLHFGTPVTIKASNSTDNAAGQLNFTWVFEDVRDGIKYGPVVNYAFECTGNHSVKLIVRDAAGNFASRDNFIEVSPIGSDFQPPTAQISDLPKSVNIGDTVQLDASGSSDFEGIADYTWYVELNNTMTILHGEQASFTAQGFGMYQIVLAVRDQAGNAMTEQRDVLSLASGMDIPSESGWSSTPLGLDIPFNMLAYVGGVAIIACVVYLGGLFSKGFAYEIQKGTAKTLFYAPISVTTMIFAKMLYPLLIGPFFIFPLVLISTIPLGLDLQQVFMVTLVSYLLTALLLASAAYGSCLIYAATRRMTVRPTTLARTFMYLSMLTTFVLLVSMAKLLDKLLVTDMWSDMYANVGSNLVTFSPFHQGGVMLSNMLLGTAQSPDWFVFVIPAILIIGGAVASRRLFPDLFSRE